ncbi:MAG: hypothetical protein H0T62_08035 [Parachlamydiaceae bacterium]|nr:hypothetical protein [Parachlamydiaceae bacterium]
MKKLLSILFCCCLTWSSTSAVEPSISTGFFADENQISIDEPEQYSVQMNNLRSIVDAFDVNIAYYYRIKAIDVDKRTVYLEDDSKWDIGWFYKDVMIDWQAGDRLSISYQFDWNGVGIRNLDKNSLAWASIWRWNFPYAEDADRVAEITYRDSYALLTLKSGFQFTLQTFQYFHPIFEVGEGVFVFQNKDSFLIKKLSCGCTKEASIGTIGNPDWRHEAQ